MGQVIEICQAYAVGSLVCSWNGPEIDIIDRLRTITIDEIEKETENGKVVYEAEITKDGKTCEVEVAEDGTLLESEADDDEADETDDD